MFPVFILLLAGMIDFGLGLYSYMSVINAAREGARYGATQCATADCAASVKQQAVSAAAASFTMGQAITASNVTVTCTNSVGTDVGCGAVTDANSRVGGYVTVTVNYSYKMIWPLTFGTAIGETSTVKMRIEAKTT